MMLKPGDILVGRYEIETLLGEGGMGAVFRAFDTLKQRKVAIKEFRLGDLPSVKDLVTGPDDTRGKRKTPAQLTREDALKLFRKEAHLLSPLENPNLPQVFDFFILGSEGYIVMTLIEGRSLGDALEENGGPLSEETLTGWLKQVLEALQYCHSKSVIHRDLKPDNLLLTADGRVYLIDFGIAKTLNPGQQMTSTGARLLTPGYAPPEQYSLKGGADLRSDLYSLGAVTYTLLTGQEPTEATDRMAGEEFPRPRLLNPGISERMERFILHCLELKKENRPASAADAAGMLFDGVDAQVKPAQPSVQKPVFVTPIMPATKPKEIAIPSQTKIESMAVELAEGISMEFVRVPAGEFRMGAAEGDAKAKSNEKPQHRVRLDEYWMGKYPVTNAQYEVFVMSTGGRTSKHWASGNMPKELADRPVVYVNWEDAKAFCEWASRKTEKTIRLPSEAEWEKAARGTDGRIYPWGNAVPNLSLANIANKIGHTTAVGSYPEGISPYGALDMAGDVWEWVADWKGTYPSDFQSNPIGPASGDYRVRRGGSWCNDHVNARVSYRGHDFPNFRYYDIGFRCVLSLGF